MRFHERKRYIVILSFTELLSHNARYIYIRYMCTYMHIYVYITRYNIRNLIENYIQQRKL